MSTTIKLRPASSSEYAVISGVADVRCSWEINRAGMFTCRIAVSTLWEAGWQRRTALGCVMKWSHPTAGDWAGIVTMYGVRDGIAEISAQGFEILTRKKLVFMPDLPKQAPGEVLKRAVDELANIGDMPARIRYSKTASANQPGYINVRDRNIRIRANPAMDFYDELMPMLTDDLGMEWRVDDDLYISYTTQLGRNLGNSVTLSDQYNVASAYWVDDLATVTNHYRGIGLKPANNRNRDGSSNRPGRTRNKPRATKKQPTATSGSEDKFVPYNVGAIDGASQALWGPQMERRDFPDVQTEDEARDRLNAELKRTAPLYSSIELDVVDLDATWNTFRHGDTVRVLLLEGNWSGTARVMARALDVARGVMTVALTATSEG